MLGWLLVGWSLGWLVGGMVGILAFCISNTLYISEAVAGCSGRAKCKETNNSPDMLGWLLVGWSHGWLVGWSVGWLIGWLVGLLVGQLVGWLVRSCYRSSCPSEMLRNY
jgi:hypothetical protein